MSSNTKIVVLKSKELIYTGIFIILGILLVLLLFYMFSPSDGKDENTNSNNSNNESQSTEATMSYKPGVYSSELNLGGSNLKVDVTVDENAVSHIQIENLDDTVTAMYPLIEPSLAEINSQISLADSIDDITYSRDNQYTTIIIMEAVKKALEPAIIK